MANEVNILKFGTTEYQLSDSSKIFRTGYLDSNDTPSTATGQNATSIGGNTHANGDWSHAEGTGTYAYGKGCHAEGLATEAGLAGNGYAHAEGAHTYATGSGSHAEGSNARAIGNNSHAEGFDTRSSGPHSHAEGYGTNASNTGSHAEGGHTYATGRYSHAEGEYSTAEGEFSHAEGYATKIDRRAGVGCHVEGDHSSIGNNNNKGGAHAEGVYTIAYGRGSHSGGYKTYAFGDGSFAHGYLQSDGNWMDWSSDYKDNPDLSRILAYGKGSFAGGFHRKGHKLHAYGDGSFAFGYITSDPNDTTGAHSSSGLQAVGKGSMAGGYVDTVNGVLSYVNGDGGIGWGIGVRTENDGEAAFGKYNKPVYEDEPDSTLFTVGNGTSSSRKNALEVRLDNSVKIAGNLVADGGISDPNAVSNIIFFGKNSNGKWGYKTSKTGSITPFRNPTGTATAAQVLSGYTFSNASGDGLTGTYTPELVGVTSSTSMEANNTITANSTWTLQTYSKGQYILFVARPVSGNLSINYAASGGSSSIGLLLSYRVASSVQVNLYALYRDCAITVNNTSSSASVNVYYKRFKID